MPSLSFKLEPKYKPVVFKEAEYKLEAELEWPDANAERYLTRLHGIVVEFAQKRIATYEAAMKDMDEKVAKQKKDFEELLKAKKADEMKKKFDEMKNLIEKTRPVLENFISGTQAELNKLVETSLKQFVAEDKALKTDKLKTKLKAAGKIGVAAAAILAGLGGAIASLAITGATMGAGAPLIIAGVAGVVGGMTAGIKTFSEAVKDIKALSQSEEELKKSIEKEWKKVGEELKKQAVDALKEKGKMDKLKEFFKKNHVKTCRELLKKHEMKTIELRNKADKALPIITSALNSVEEIKKKVADPSLPKQTSETLKTQAENIGKGLKVLIEETVKSKEEINGMEEWNKKQTKELDDAEKDLKPDGFGSKFTPHASKLKDGTEKFLAISKDVLTNVGAILKTLDSVKK